jgi:hypothetical protein
MTDILGASAVADRAFAAAPSSPAVSPVPASIPSADDTIQVGGKAYLRFHPLHKKVKDGTLRCFACGQIDDEPWHDAAYCPGMGGEIPFPTSTLKLSLKVDSGFRHDSTQRITLTQWRLVSAIISADDGLVRDIVDQSGRIVGEARTPLKDMLTVQAFVDEKGTVWAAPTAWAYFAACRALNASGMSAGTAETAEQAQGEARQPDGDSRDAQGQSHD